MSKVGRSRKTRKDHKVRIVDEHELLKLARATKAHHVMAGHVMAVAKMALREIDKADPKESRAILAIQRAYWAMLDEQDRHALCAKASVLVAEHIANIREPKTRREALDALLFELGEQTGEPAFVDIALDESRTKSLLEWIDQPWPGGARRTMRTDALTAKLIVHAAAFGYDVDNRERKAEQIKDSLRGWRRDAGLIVKR